MLKRVGQGTAFALLLAAFGAAASDYAVFVWRLRHGTALDSVTVRQYLSTPLKNGRDELDYLGETDQPCVRALLPHQRTAPCWWVRAHKDRWTQS
jgi:hypothetical protein